MKEFICKLKDNISIHLNFKVHKYQNNVYSIKDTQFYYFHSSSSPPPPLDN